MNETPAETVSTPPRRRQAINIDTSFDQWYSDEVADAITPTSSKGGKRKPRQGHHRRVTSPCDENAVTELRMCSLRQQAASQALSIHSLRNFGNNQRKNTFRMDIQDKINLVDALVVADTKEEKKRTPPSWYIDTLNKIASIHVGKFSFLIMFCFLWIRKKKKIIPSLTSAGTVAAAVTIAKASLIQLFSE
jgi:hypothetical protein